MPNYYILVKCSSSKYQCLILKALVNLAASPFVLPLWNTSKTKLWNGIYYNGRLSFIFHSLNQQKTTGVNTGLQPVSLIFVLRFAENVHQSYSFACLCITKVLGSYFIEEILSDVITLFQDDERPRRMNGNDYP